MIITIKQWLLVAVIVAAMVVDVAITLYGVWFQYGNFYEANPLFAMVGILNTPETFTIGLILIKTIGIGLVIYLISICNSIGRDWGDAACYGGAFFATGIVGVLITSNIWKIFL